MALEKWRLATEQDIGRTDVAFDVSKIEHDSDCLETLEIQREMEVFFSGMWCRLAAISDSRFIDADGAAWPYAYVLAATKADAGGDE